MIRIGVYGAYGRMGARIIDLAAKDKDIKVVLRVERADHPDMGKDPAVIPDSGLELGGVDCMIDFTSAAPALGHVAACAAAGTAMVIGTTGFDMEGETVIKKASAKIPIVFSPNMAVGVNLVFELVRKAAAAIGRSFSVMIDETHHVHKKDSPSGTAKKIASVVKEVSGIDALIESKRIGEIVGNHGIVFENEFETIEIRHDAKSRDCFASGALAAAKFVVGKHPGLYTMKDVLGL